MASSMSSCTESRIHKDLALDEPLLNREKCFDTDSKFSLSSFASTRLPPLSTFSGPSTTSYHPPTALDQINSHPQNQGSGNVF